MSIIVNIDGKSIILQDSERTVCECWDRVMGYFRPVSDWNEGKRQEHLDRVRYRESPELRAHLFPEDRNPFVEDAAV